jgi:hypothetical protein
MAVTAAAAAADEDKKKKCYTVIKQLRCKRTAGLKGCSRHDKGTVPTPTSKRLERNERT